ncbi:MULTISPECIES: ScpA family protein [unclassified Lactobacillus]|uniref:segregation and condensation protein A n=1 Tax=unclassified Lactobacillus TaxID=2620435 RepID=UPI000EFD9C20|nr:MULTISPECIES: segregation/condensation protein A [unclassified Lactobacillus]RMC25162.1 segregation and condensation protein A [Lactobacillus sp. ESL0247]RMC29316.1 segregation and condensation protein A [Lactobacillus sp. ESL0246]RMC32337.1 segregation and condensation protein A [Lactobacillus sp. ESL0245]
MTNNLTLELPNFEGPLDLLLHLIKSQKIDIYDIPIAQITSQYLAYLHEMQRLNLKVAGEYFVMSSMLLRIKSQSLLPKNDFTDNQELEEDPRDELVQQLVQYSVFKKVSLYFKKRNEEVPITAAKEESVPQTKKIDPLPLGKITSSQLVNTFIVVLQRLKISHLDNVSIASNETSITEMTDFLECKLATEKTISFFSCSDQLNSLSDVIGLFLALLELCKQQQIKVRQSHAFGDLEIERIG